MKILSTKNIKLKEFLKLQKKKLLRLQEKIFLVEGQKEISMALKKYRPHELFLNREICGYISSLEKKFPLIIDLNAFFFKKLTYKKESEGIIATFHRHNFSRKKLQLPKNPILLILVGIEKPGNLGAILRSAEAIGIDIIILSEMKTDFFHPNVIRSSLGTIFSHKIMISLPKKNWLQKKKISLLSTSLKEKTSNFFKNDLKFGIAIIIGNESLGLSDHWISISDRQLRVPMNGNLDSLNVSNAVSIILFEVLRQRMDI